ncbi:ERF family protein [Streptomyces bottropensis]|uniref:ERF family protein n=1 Tax=Streptomyces bottropensis TaxID=42235 RepID=UPI0036B028E6
MADTTIVAEHATEKPSAVGNKAMTVDEAMTAVMREIGPVGKNGHNDYQNYDFRAYEDIVAAVREPMVRYGLKLLPEVIKQEHFTRGENTNVAILTVKYTVRGPAGDVLDTPIIVVGEGADRADKASNKAMTAAKKYAYLQAFEIADGTDDGDREHPVASGGANDRPMSSGNPLNWYIEQINKREVWFNAQTLRALLDRAEAAGVAGLHMPDKPGVSFREVVERQGNKLMAEQQERTTRQAEEAGAMRAQMSAEYPEPADPYDEWSQAAPRRPAPQRQAPSPPPAPTPPPTPPAQPPVSAPPQGAPAPQWSAPPAPSPALPNVAAVEQEFAKAVSNSTYGHQALNDMRAHYGAGALAQTAINTERWGTVDANSAITLALTSWESIVRELLPPTTEPTRDAVPEATEAAEAPEPRQLRMARRTANMGAEERGREAMIAEAVLQAQMLGMDTLEYVADLLPSGATDIEDIKGGSRLMDLVKEHRPQVLAAFTQKGMTRAAAEYAKFGERVPARDINGFLKNVLGVG